MGSLADAHTREWRRRAHAALDGLWQGGSMSRTAAYRWMADAMGLAEHEAHIGRMGPDECGRLIELVAQRRG